MKANHKNRMLFNRAKATKNSIINNAKNNEAMAQMIIDDLKRQALEENREQLRDEIFNDVLKNVIMQMLAFVLVTLDVEYGWKKKRLKTFVKSMNRIGDILDKGAFMGKTATAVDCYRYLKDKHGIDTQEISDRWMSIDH